MTQKAIALEFGISINTVGNLAANAYRKLDVHGAAAAVHTFFRIMAVQIVSALVLHASPPECGARRVSLPSARG